MAVDELASVWRALADPTRRRLLDLLSGGPRTTGQLSDEFAMTRIAVSKHLALLQSVGLVLFEKRGRQRWNYINFVPLRQVYEHWLQPHQARWASSFAELKRHVEGQTGETMGESPLSIDIVQGIALKAPAYRVFKALTDDIGAWWGHPYLNPDAIGLRLEPVLGGRFYEEWEDQAGALLANVSTIAPGERLG